MNARTMKHRVEKTVVYVDGVCLYIGTEEGGREYYAKAQRDYPDAVIRMERKASRR